MVEGWADIYKVQGSSTSPHKADLFLHTCDPSALEVEERGSQRQGHSWFHRELGGLPGMRKIVSEENSTRRGLRAPVLANDL